MSDQCRAEALRYLSSRLRSEQQVRDRLTQKEYDEDAIEDTIAFLYEYHYLDEREFCAAFIHDKVQFAPCGRAKLAYELRQKGIDGDIAFEALAEEYPEEDELETAERLWRKKAAQSPGTETLKLKRYLAAKGFSYDIIAQVCDKNLEYLDELE